MWCKAGLSIFGGTKFKKIPICVFLPLCVCYCHKIPCEFLSDQGAKLAPHLKRYRRGRRVQTPLIGMVVVPLFAIHYHLLSNVSEARTLPRRKGVIVGQCGILKPYAILLAHFVLLRDKNGLFKSLTAPHLAQSQILVKHMSTQVPVKHNHYVSRAAWHKMPCQT